MKIYTKTGDKGQTSLFGGKRVPKYDLRVETYGTIDELNSFIGLLRSQNIKDADKHVLLAIQNQLFSIGSVIATEDISKLKIPLPSETTIKTLEKEMDNIDSGLAKQMNFVIPGGNQAIGYCHVCRSVCRRAERLIVKLADETKVDGIIIQYINRLSDYFFLFSRKITSDFNIPEAIWKPG
ncbi:MAG: ATP:cob(I)alamin adenosyltransferase [Bacteroidetes bacterium 4572_117]|nr:MAG: ATP:cob(I)alamin adenosyltransferase [Bacteroidetes bacterium 4572_117]